jgi:hypothetical protein
MQKRRLSSIPKRQDALQEGEGRTSCRKGGATMRDLVADWNKWRAAERVLAVIVTLLLAMVPLGLLMVGKSGI